MVEDLSPHSKLFQGWESKQGCKEQVVEQDEQPLSSRQAHNLLPLPCWFQMGQETDTLDRNQVSPPGSVTGKRALGWSCTCCSCIWPCWAEAGPLCNLSPLHWSGSTDLSAVAWGKTEVCWMPAGHRWQNTLQKHTTSTTLAGRHKFTSGMLKVHP